MKKLLNFFYLIIVFSLVFVGCQSTEDINSPVGDLDKNKGNSQVVSITPINVVAGVNTCIELVAGQHQVVGTVCIETVGSNLKVTYNITENDWSIAETHLAVVGNPDDFPRTNNGNPKVGHFPYKGTHNDVGSVEYLVPIGNLPAMVYVAAHAVVKNCELILPATGLCPSFPENSNMTPTWNPGDAPLYTVKATFDFGTRFGFCVDNSKYISSGQPRLVNFICSYDDMPVCTPPQFFIEKPENLDLVNWIINNRLANWDRRTLQAVIWKLINPTGTLTNWSNPNVTPYWTHNATLREQIITLAIANGEGFEPACNQKVLVLVYGPGEICNTPWQVLAFEETVECEPGECGSETAWAFPYNNGPIPDKSALFGSQWARYFSYLR